MYELEKIQIITDDIRMYIKKIEGMKILSIQINDLIFDACSMNCFSLLNKIIDLAEEIIKKNDSGTPYKYRDLFDMLASLKIIDNKLSKEIGDMVILRNKFSHRYDKITEKELKNFVRNIDKIKLFVDKIEEEVKK